MGSVYDNRIMSQVDLDRVDKLQKQWQNAKTQSERKKLHDEVEQIRSGYGYSGGQDGSEYIVTDKGLAALANASSQYSDAIDNAVAEQVSALESQKESVDSDLEKELREAYISRLKNDMGLEQRMRAGGISGGAAESIRAQSQSEYLGQRNDAKAEASAIKSELTQKANELVADARLDKAENQLKYEADRADYLVGKDKTEYEKAQDRFDNAYKLLKEGVYSSTLAGALGISDSEVRQYLKNPSTDALRDLAWKMVQKGYYDPSFPSLLGYDEAIIRGYIAQISK